MTKAIIPNHYQNWSQDKKFFSSVQRRKPVHQRHHHYKASMPRSYYTEFQGKTYCHTCQHIHTINTEIPVSQDHRQEIVMSHKTINKVNTTVIILFHKTIITATEFLFCKTINKGTNINIQLSSLQPPNSIDQLLQYLVTINGHSNILPGMNQDITLTLGIPNSTSSEHSSASSSQTSSSYDMEEEITRSDDESIISTTSD